MDNFQYLIINFRINIICLRCERIIEAKKLKIKIELLEEAIVLQQNITAMNVNYCTLKI